MTPDQHAQRIRRLQFELFKANYGMGMPRDAEHVAQLQRMLAKANDNARNDGYDVISDGFEEEAS